MGSLYGFLFLSFAILYSASCYPSEEPPLGEEGVTAIGEAISMTAPSPTKPAVKSDGTVADRTRLRKDLFKDYDHKINPDNVTVKYGIALIDFDIDEEKSTVETGLWQRLVWKDSRLAWDEADYGGIGVLRLESDDVWKPDITLYNSANEAKRLNCWKSNVLIYPNGEVLWVPPCEASSRCHLNLKESPYGEQNCTMKFGSWTYDGFIMDMQFYNKQEEMDLSDFFKSPKWEIVSNTAKRTEKYYDCCAEPYPDISYHFTFKRRSEIPCSTKADQS